MARVARRDPAAQKAYQQAGTVPDFAALARQIVSMQLHCESPPSTIRLMRLTCLANLQQIGQIWTMYSNDNDGYFPAHGISFGNWRLITQDQKDIFVERYKLRSGGIFYCPNFLSLWGDNSAEGMWASPRNETDDLGRPVVTYGISYAVYAGRADALIMSLVLRNNTPPPIKNRDKRLAERPLAMDETSYTSPPWSTFSTYGYSNHFEKGTFPNGGNALFGDGHVEWRNWKKMVRLMDTGSFKRYF